MLVVGAHIGTLAIPLSKICKTVHAIEANPNTYSLLAKNILLDCCTNCHAYQFAAQDKPGEIEFLANRQNSGGSKLKPLVRTILLTTFYSKTAIRLILSGFKLSKSLSETLGYFALRNQIIDALKALKSKLMNLLLEYFYRR